MSEKTKQKRRLPSFDPRCIVTLMLAAVIFYVNFRIVGKCYHPFVYNDEMGYWMHAAEMSGLDWRGVSYTVAWYSYGYSLLLVPLMKLFSDTVALYRAALILNIVMDIVCYFLYVYIIRRLFPKLELITASVAAAAGILYTSYQFNSGVAFSETALLFAATLVVFLMVRILEKPTYLNSACLGLACAYMYMVHNRTIGIAASAVFVIIAALICKKVKLRQSGAFLLALIAGFTADKLIKGRLVSALWENGASGNDAGSVVGRLKTAVSSVQGFKKLLGVMAGQGFAVSAGTFCLVLFALLVMTRRGAAGALKAGKVVRSGKKLSETADSRYLMFLFIFCAFVSTYLISSIFMIDFRRIDHVLYTRYFDIVVGILIMSGICFLFEADKWDLLIIMAIPFIMRVGAAGANRIMPLVEDPTFNKVCAPPICRLFELNERNFHAFISYSVSWFFVLAAVSWFLRYKKLSIYICSVICAVLFTCNTPSAQLAITVNQNAYEGDRALCQRVKELPEKHIYVMSDAGTFISFLQYEMNDVRVDIARDAATFDEDGYIFASRSSVVDLMDHEIIDRSDRHILYSARKTETAENKIPLDFMSVFDSECYIPSEDMIESSPEFNYLCYGPYMHLDSGDYTFALDLDFDGADGAEEIGYAEVNSDGGQTVYVHEEITADMLDRDGQLELELGAELENSVKDVEIVVFLYEPESISAQLRAIEVKTED